MKIGRLEIIWHGKSPDHPDYWSKRKINAMVREIEAHNPNGKIDRIKILRNLTYSYCSVDEPRWGLAEQKEWVERNCENCGMGHS